MAVLDEFAEAARMEKVMLCVFRYNEAAVSFYRERDCFELDTSSRFNAAQQDVYELCKWVGAASSSAAAASSPQADLPLR
eukprot:672363-Rhodomonas_salina.1